MAVPRRVSYLARVNPLAGEGVVVCPHFSWLLSSSMNLLSAREFGEGCRPSNWRRQAKGVSLRFQNCCASQALRTIRWGAG